MKQLLCLVGALSLAVPAVVSAGTYQPTKDTYFRNTGDAALNDSTVRGANTSDRAARDINLAFYLSDFDRAGIIAEVRSISGNASNPLSLTDMAAVQLHWMVKMNLGAEGETPATNQAYLDAKYGVTTLQTLTPNWTEAASTNNYVNWTGTAATSTRWKDLAGLDITNNDAGGEINQRWHLRWDQTMPLTVWGGTADLVDANLDLPHRDWLLSDALELDFLTNPNVAGLAFIGDTNALVNTNMEVWSREAAAGDQPFLTVNAVPEPASLSLLALGGLALLRRRSR